MKNSTVLVLLNNETSDQYVKDISEGALPQNMHLSFLLMSAGVAAPPMIYGAPLYGTIDLSDNWQNLLNEALAAQRNRVEEIENLLTQVGASADVQSVLCSPADASLHVARRAKVCDLAVIAPNMRQTPQLFREAAYGVLYKSPIGLMVNAGPTLNVNRALVAWDSSQAASCAVHSAMPYLLDAEEVNVVCFDPISTQDEAGADPGADLAVWLSHHGCSVVVSQEPSGGKEIAKCIQSRAEELGADLIVLGAYGHSRLVQSVFGGTTRAMLEQAELPVLVAH